MSKPRTAVLLIIIALFSLSACSSSTHSAAKFLQTAMSDMQAIADDAEVNKPDETAVPAPSATPLPSPSPTAAPTPSPDPTPEPTPPPEIDSIAEVGQKAAYLRYSPISALSNDELRSDFVKIVRSTVIAKYGVYDLSADLTDSVIFGENANIGFLLSCVDASGLTDVGTFDVLPDCSMQYSYLTNVNAFPSCSLGELALFGGTLAAQAGDIIFWFDENGNAKNYAIVVSADDAHLGIVLTRATGESALFETCIYNVSQRFISSGRLVHLTYPCIEQTVYFFCVNELGYSPAAACGVMANIYKESSFRSYIESSGSYGLCQWLGERKQELISWCRSNSLDYTTVEAQLKYLKHELTLEKYYGLDALMRTYGSSAQDAYDAAREWCYKYESPANAGVIGRDRGLIARDEFFPIYSQY